MEVQRKKQKGSPHIMTSFALKENTHSQDDRHSFFRSTKQDHSQTRQSIRIQAATDSPYYQCLLRSPWSVRRLTAKYGMSYLTYFIAFMHRFPCTFCAHFFHNSEFQQIIVGRTFRFPEFSKRYEITRKDRSKAGRICRMPRRHRMGQPEAYSLLPMPILG